MKKEEIYKHLGSLVSSARTDAGLTQKQLAEILETTQPNIARAENIGCSLSLASKCLDVCGFSITDIEMRAKDIFKKEGITRQARNAISSCSQISLVGEYL